MIGSEDQRDRPVDVGLLRERAAAWTLEAPLRAALDAVVMLWPETAAAVAPLRPAGPVPSVPALEALRSLLRGP